MTKCTFIYESSHAIMQFIIIIIDYLISNVKMIVVQPVW